jgi:hypothetical protein
MKHIELGWCVEFRRLIRKYGINFESIVISFSEYSTLKERELNIDWEKLDKGRSI